MAIVLLNSFCSVSLSFFFHLSLFIFTTYVVSGLAEMQQSLSAPLDYLLTRLEYLCSELRAARDKKSHMFHKRKLRRVGNTDRVARPHTFNLMQ